MSPQGQAAPVPGTTRLLRHLACPRRNAQQVYTDGSASTEGRESPGPTLGSAKRSRGPDVARRLRRPRHGAVPHAAPLLRGGRPAAPAAAQEVPQAPGPAHAPVPPRPGRAPQGMARSLSHPSAGGGYGGQVRVGWPPEKQGPYQRIRCLEVLVDIKPPFGQPLICLNQQGQMQMRMQNALLIQYALGQR